ncbi:hypothetical protein [Nocardia sp. CC227C]|uniref:hypothetical protein n=1 Tax=Nocardia sp. CC227C TaxID=3044562 RepID=UPI00278C1B4A|nr:hypothetical protein [Nocardia sp. CC227C]
MDQLEQRHLPGGTGENYLILFQGQPIGVYKPRKSFRTIRNEVTAWEASRILGVGNVPHTREWVGHKGSGTLQAFVPNKGPGLGFGTERGRETAAFDYVMADADAHAENAIRSGTGEIVRIDNAGIIPDRLSNQANLMRSTYVTENLGVPLPAHVVDRINDVDPREFSDFLQSRGYSRSASDWAADRLTEAQGGVINGDSWGCAILDDGMRVGYPSGYSNLGEYWKAHPPLPEEMREIG